MIVYGRNAVLEALRAGRRRTLRVWLGRAADQELIRADVDTTVAGLDGLDQICGSSEHQGFVAELEPYPYVDENTLLANEQALVVALDQVQDPQNLGAICRTAEVAGASGVVIPARRSACVTPASCRASAGAVEHLKVARVGNLADFLAGAKKTGAWVYGASADAETRYTEPDYSGRVVVVLGSEGEGLRLRVASSCDRLISIPVRGAIGSLNVAASCAVLVYEVVRQRTN